MLAMIDKVMYTPVPALPSISDYGFALASMAAKSVATTLLFYNLTEARSQTMQQVHKDHVHFINVAEDIVKMVEKQPSLFLSKEWRARL